MEAHPPLLVQSCMLKRCHLHPSSPTLPLGTRAVTSGWKKRWGGPRSILVAVWGALGMRQSAVATERARISEENSEQQLR